MAELTKRLRLYLAYALTCDVELFSDLLKGAGAPVVETEAQLQHVLLTGR